jgi:hypothetical protein
MDLRTLLRLVPFGSPFSAPRDLPVCAKDGQQLNSSMHGVQSAM